MWVSLFVFFVSIFVGCSADPYAMTLNVPTPIMDTKLLGEVIHLTISVPAIPQGSELFFVLTPISGDGDLAVCWGGGACKNSSEGHGLEIVQFEELPQATDFDIFVVGYKNNIVFTALVYFTDTDTYAIELVDGIPQLGKVRWADWTVFKFDSTEPGLVTLSISDLEGGDTDICVTKDGSRPTRWSSCWIKKNLPGSDVVQWQQTNESLTYLIGVYGYQDGSIFNILLSHEDTIAVVPESFPLEFELHNPNEKMFFKYFLPPYDPHQEHAPEGLDFTLVRRSSHGDVDLYVSREFTRGGTKPVPGNSTWRSLRWGGRPDIVTVLADDASFSSGWWYASVNNYVPPGQTSSDVKFDLTIARKEGHTILLNGRSFRAEAKAGAYEWFMFLYQAPQEISIPPSIDIYVEPTFGLLDIYASAGDDNPYPDEQNHDPDLQQSHIGMTTVMHIQNPTSGDVYYFGVRAAQYSNFTITCSVNSRPNYIQVGETATADVAQGAFKYFLADVGPEPVFDIQISLTTTSFSNSDLYVNVHPNFPNLTSYDHKSDSIWITTDVIVIHPTEFLEAVDFDGFLRIGIYGESGSRSYFNLAVMNVNSTLELKNAKPVSGLVSQRESVFYRYYMTNRGRLTINLKAFEDEHHPDVDLYIGYQYVPTLRHYVQKSIQPGSLMDYCTIDADPGWWYVMVYGYSPGSYMYRISAAAQYEVLSPFGSQLVDTVEKGNWRYFTSNVIYDNLDRFVVGTTLISGATSLFLINDTTNPSPDNYIAKSERWPINFAEVFFHDWPHEWYQRWTIGVYGLDDSSFYIHAAAPVFYEQTQNFQGQLTPSIPMAGRAYVEGDVQYFSWKTKALAGVDYRLAIRLFNQSQSVLNVYIAQDPISTPDAHHHTWAFRVDHDGLFYIRTRIVADKFFYFGFSAELSDCDFEVAFSSVLDPITLTQETQLPFTTKANEVVKYQFFSDIYSKGLFVQVDSCTERIPPPLYVSKSWHMPNESSHDLASTAYHYYSQRIATTDPKFQFVGHPYFMSTGQSPFPQQFTIYAYSRADFRPLVVPNSINSTVQTTGDHSDVELTILKATSPHFDSFKYHVYLREVVGDETKETINVYTSCSVTSSTMFRRLATISSESLPAGNTFTYDFSLPLHLFYAVIIVVESPHGHLNNYDPVWVMTGEPLTLVMGEAKFASVDAGAHVQYKIQAIDPSNAGYELIVALTPLDGDVDISLRSTTKPSVYFNSSSYGMDIIMFKLTTETSFGPFTVDIFGEKDCEFSLLYHVNRDQNFVSVYDGAPQIFKTPHQRLTYFKFQLDEDSSFALGVTPILGDPDVYVSVTYHNPSLSICRPAQCWSSSSTTLDFIQVDRDDDRYRPDATYYVGVYAYGSTDAVYSFAVVKSESIEQLSAGIPYGRIVPASGYVYFKYEHKSDEDLSITVSPFSVFGDPDIYASKTVRRPSSVSATWREIARGTDSMVIKKSQGGGQGMYYISVYGYRYETDFTILVQSVGSSMVLVDGVAQDIFDQDPDTYKFFRVFHGYVENALHLVASPTRGSVQMFASRTVTHPRADDAHKYHDWHSLFDGSIAYIDIPKTTPIGWIYIGVLSVGPFNADYNLMAQSVQRATLLTNARLSSGHVVLEKYYKYFEIELPLDDPYAYGAVVVLLPDRGDPDLYVSCNNTRPTRAEDQHDWHSTSISRDSVAITADELRSKECTMLHIGVYGFSVSSFSILAYFEGTLMELYADTVVPGYIENGYNQYRFHSWYDSSIYINLQMRTQWPADGDLYVSTQPHPDQLHHEWSSTHAFSDDFVSIDDAEEGKDYYIAVHAYRGPFEYSISVSPGPIEIIDGEQMMLSMSAGHSRCFQTTLQYNTRRIIASVTPIDGRTYLYGNPNETVPEGGGLFVSENYPNVLTVDESRFTGQEFPRDWSFCVEAVTDAAFYFGVLSDRATGLLQSGETRVAAASSLYPAYFKFFQVSEDPDKRYFLLVNGYKSEDTPACFNVYVSQRTECEFPTQGCSEWRHSSKADEDQVVMSLDGLIRDPENSHLFVAVRACDMFGPMIGTPPFSIVIGNQYEPVYLLHDRVVSFSDEYTSMYAFRTSRQATNVYVQLDACHDFPALMTTMDVMGPDGKVLPYTHQRNGYSIVANYLNVPALDSEYNISVKTPVGHNLEMYSLFVTTQKDQRPYIPEATVIQTHIEEELEDTVGIRILSTEARHDVYGGQLEYRVYFMPLDDHYENMPTDINFWTICSMLENKKTKDGGTLLVDRGSVTSVVYIPNDKDVLLNILVQTPDSVRNIYSPVHIPALYKPPPPKPIPPNHTKVVVAVVVSIAVTILVIICAYFVLGTIIRAVCLKVRGVDMIPHASAVQNLCCPPQGKKYGAIDDEMDEGEIVLDDEVALSPEDSNLIGDDMDPAVRDELDGYGGL